MEVHFSPEQEAQLSQIANYAGTRVEQLLKEAALRMVERMVEEDAQIRAGIHPEFRWTEATDNLEHP
jgi:hypothetical protein